MTDDAALPARRIALALEGGGALGAFTWGVLDRLLAVPSLRIEVVSGTSAGAMNAAMLVHGLARGGPSDAGQLLETFWQRIAIAAGSLPGPTGHWLHVAAGTMEPMLAAVRTAGSALGVQMGARAGALGVNPLRGILAELLDPPRFGDPGSPAIIVAATNVRTGEARLFRGAEVGIDALLASACLPQIFPAIEIDGESFWDGGYSSNPPVRALIEAGAPSDILIVRTTPGARTHAPHGATAVKDRVSELTFGTPLRAELRNLGVAQASLAGLTDLPSELSRLRDARLHMISPASGDEQSASKTLVPSWPLLAEQRRRGIQAATRWIDEHLDAVGRRSTIALGHITDRPAATPRNQEGIRHAS